ncbi:hypothetical protein ACS0TY_026500 [Phlomoides rotata]
MEEQRMRRNRGMTSKNQKRTQNKYSLRDEPILQPLRMLSTQNKYSLRDEPILQPLRMLTTEDHSHSARGQFDMTNCWDTNMRMVTRTHEHGRTHHECAVDKGQAPIVATHGSNT